MTTPEASTLPTTDWTKIHAELIRPFDPADVDVKVQALSRDRDKAMVVLFADARVYQDRLDAIVGSENWQVEYRPIQGSYAVIASLTILGVVKEDVGEHIKPDDKEENYYTTALAQAFKRACTAFGLGRYLYSLPKKWVDYDREKNRLKDDPAMLVRQLYQAAKLHADKATGEIHDEPYAPPAAKTTAKATTKPQPQPAAAKPQAAPAVEREGDDLRAEIRELHAQEINLLQQKHNNNGKLVHDDAISLNTEKGRLRTPRLMVSELEAIRDAARGRVDALTQTTAVQAQADQQDLADIPF